MIALVKKNSFLFVGATLVWFSWSAVQEEVVPSEAVDRSVPVIAEELLGMRGAETAALSPADPFQMAQILAKVAEAREADANAQYSSGGGPEDPAAEEDGQVTAALVIRLDSALSSGSYRSAVINGQRCLVGDAVAGLDPDQPATVTEITGRTATVLYQGEFFVLDMVDRREIALRDLALMAGLLGGGARPEEGG